MAVEAEITNQQHLGPFKYRWPDGYEDFEGGWDFLLVGRCTAGGEEDVAAAEQRFAHCRRVESGGRARRPASVFGCCRVEVILLRLSDCRTGALQHAVHGAGAHRPRERLDDGRIWRHGDGSLLRR